MKNENLVEFDTVLIHIYKGETYHRTVDRVFDPQGASCFCESYARMGGDELQAVRETIKVSANPPCHLNR